MEDSPKPEDRNQPEPDAPLPTPAAGSSITPDSAPAVPAEAPASSPTPPPVTSGKPKRSGGKKTLILLLVLIIIAAVAAGAYMLFKPDKKTTAGSTSGKHDIPLLRFGENTGEVPDYPVTYANSITDTGIIAQQYEGLVNYQNQTRLAPLLATSWSNPDDSTWVFKLRQGIKFHTGRTMTADDVKASLDYAVVHQNDDNGGSGFILASTIKQVDVVNPYEVRITTDGPDPVLLNRLVFLPIFDSKAKLGDYNAGTGPYVVKPGTTPDSSHLDLVAVNNYWGGHVYTRELDITIDTAQGDLAKQTAAGKYDFSGDYVGSDLVTIKQFKSFDVPTEGINYVGLASAQPNSLMHNLAARQAVAYALNVPAILKAGGLKGQQANQLVPQLLPGYDPSIATTTFNLSKAKELLSSVPGSNQQLSLAYPSGDDEIVNEIAKQLTAAGFNVKPILVNDFDALVTDTNSGKYDMFYLGDTSSTQDGLDILTQLLTGVDYYQNDQVDSLVQQASSTLDASTRIKEMQQIATIIDQQKPLIPLFYLTKSYVLTKPYHLTVDTPGNPPGVYFWKAYQ